MHFSPCEFRDWLIVRRVSNRPTTQNHSLINYQHAFISYLCIFYSNAKPNNLPFQTTCSANLVPAWYVFKQKVVWKYSGWKLQWYGVANALMYSGLTLNQYGVASPCRTICTVCGFVALSWFKVNPLYYLYTACVAALSHFYFNLLYKMEHN